jgi:hypothetical protein
MRCKSEHFPLNGLPTTKVRDAAPRCSGLATQDNDEPLVATFSVGHASRQHLGELRVHDAGGHVATFFGGHTATLGPDGSLHIRKPGAAYSAATKDAPLTLSQRLVNLNKKHAEFWRRKS